MKNIISILFLVSGVMISVFFTSKQFVCDKSTCSYNGIKTIEKEKQSYTIALENAKNLEARRSELTQKYNSISIEDINKLENLLPNNVDNIKLVLELETLAQKYDLLIENPKLETSSLTSGNTNIAGGPNLRTPNDPSILPYGTFTMDFSVRSNYQNLKYFIEDIEKNLRLIEIVGIELKVPENIDKTKIKKYPPGTYDVNIKAVIYYLKN